MQPAAAEFDREFRLAHRAMRRKIDTFVANNAHKLPGQAIDPDDLRSEMLIVLWNAVATYDPDRGSKFNTHFWTCVNNRFKSMLRFGEADKRRANVKVEMLSQDAVTAAVEARLERASAEDEAIARITVFELAGEVDWHNRIDADQWEAEISSRIAG